MSSRELSKWVALNNLPGIGPRRIATVFREFGSLDLFFSGDWGRLAAITGLRETALPELQKKLDLDAAYAHINRCLASQVQIVSLACPDYPQWLAQTYDPPPILYYQGKLPKQESFLLAVVGARKATAYGKSVAAKLTADLVRAQVGIVSGLALGIDGSAHRSCLDAGGYTLAVLGCGPDIYYPRVNTGLQVEIGQRGCLISEFPPGTRPAAHNFPRRNRIIAGLTRGVLVVEASPKSGAMITVGFALEQGRDVFAVPGNITSPVSQGSNLLIQQGAKAVLSAKDILDEYNLLSIGVRPVCAAADDSEQQLLKCIDYQGVSFDYLCQATQLPEPSLLAKLVSLELKGMISRQPGHIFIRNAGVEVE